ncbi:MAG: SDR family oxidoreductase, partial [Planctomycetota bacterium]
SDAVPALVRGDVGEWSEAQRVVERAAEALGGLDALVLHATEPLPGRSGHFETLTESAWAERGEDPLRAALACARAAAPLLRRHEGAVVLVGAVGAHTRDDLAALAGGALLGLVAPLARALAPEVRVNGVALGAVGAEARDALDASDERHRLEQVPLGRLGQPEDAAAAVLFFVSADASFITGHTLVVDGGRSVL